MMTEEELKEAVGLVAAFHSKKEGKSRYKWFDRYMFRKRLEELGVRLKSGDEEFTTPPSRPWPPRAA